MRIVQNVGLILIQAWTCSAHDYGTSGAGLVGMRHLDGTKIGNYIYMRVFSNGKCPTCQGIGRYTVPKNCSHQKGAVHYY